MKITDYTDALLSLRDAISVDKIYAYLDRNGINLGQGHGQYEGLKWIRCKFNHSTIGKLKSEYEGVMGFHIMPYRIKMNNLEGIVCSDKYFHSFNEQDENFSDYDPSTGNIHICPNGEWQIVLIKNNPGYGPGWSNEIKQKFYFPSINSTEKSIQAVNDKAIFISLLDYINNVIGEITE